VHVLRGVTTGELVAIEPGSITIRREGRTESVALRSVREIVAGQVVEPRVPPPFTVWHVDGHEMQVRAMEEGRAPGTVDLTGYGWTGRGVPLAALRAVAARRLLTEDGEVLAAFERARADAERTRDVVVATAEGRVQTVSCVVRGLSSRGVRVSAGGRERTTTWDRCAGVVLSAAAGEPAPNRLHVIALTDGTVIEAQSLALASGVLSARMAPAEYSVQFGRVAGIRVAGPDYAYLSDLPIEAVESEPQLDVVWPPRLDRAVAGSPLRLDGVEYAKGIGMHPETRLTFRRPAALDRLLGIVGVDDTAGNGGSVTFLVLGDGRAVAEVGPLTGADGPQDVDANVAGAQTVSLAVQPGDPLVLSGNLADWCDLRLVRTPQGDPGTPSTGAAAR
jgi:hypothetical protein